MNTHEFIKKLPKWNHNIAYHTYVLKQLSSERNIAYDYGCGLGILVKKLAKQFKNVIGIDSSSKIIECAKSYCYENNITFIESDIEDRNINIKADFIVSIATIHHLDIENFFCKVKDDLNYGGKLIVIDLYQQTTLFEYLINTIAIPINVICSFVYKNRNEINQEEMWDNHSSDEKYLKFEEIKTIAKRNLGDIKMKRLLFWRYCLIWEKR